MNSFVTGSDIATGSGHQQPSKRKLSPVKEVRNTILHKPVINGSPVAKKKFVPTIPPTRSKKTSDSPSLKERKPIQPYKGIPRRGGHGRGTKNGMNNLRQPHQRRPVNHGNRPVAQYQKPVLVQMEGSLFGQGVAMEKGKHASKLQNQATLDPVLNALSAVDRFEDLQNNNLSTRLLKSQLLIPQSSSADSKSPESQLESNQLILKRDSQIHNEDQVVVNQKLSEKLKFHQVEGVKFMWNACFRTSTSAGCVLAHCMGLGKSLQVVTLTHTVLTNAICQVNRVMVVCPLSTVLNWENEFRIWLPGDTFTTLNVCELASSKTSKTRETKIKKWLNIGGVLILGYEMFRTLTKEKKKLTEQDEVFRQALVDPGPDVLICDEGHLLKNEDSEIYKAMNQICTRRRIMLTGTPLQNSLFEFYTMVQFVKPGQLGTKAEFGKRFVKPLEKGQAVDSTPEDVRVMKRRALILHKMLENIVQRFDSNVLAPFLPPKYEYVVSIRMSELQIRLYLYYLENHTKGGSIQPSGNQGESAGLFSDFQQLARVWTHPKALLLACNRPDSRNSTRHAVSKISSSGEGKAKKNAKNDDDDDYLMRTEEQIFGEDVCMQDPVDQALTSSSSPWWSDLISENEINNIEHSGKFVLLMDILRECELIGDKLLVFSQSLTSLDLIEEFLAIEDFKNQIRSTNETNGKVVGGTWNINTDYFRLDGSTSSEQRLKWCRAFNDPQNPRSRLFIISTRAGGIGINLVGANRVIIFDASWNPSHDLQSVFRVYRLGQKKPCYIYRFVAQGTMEEKIYYRQVAKLSLSRRIVDEEQIDRYFGSNDLTDLYTFNADGQFSLPASIQERDDSSLLDDNLLAGVAVRLKEWVGGYQAHDSLLQNRPEEYLEDSEQQAIWKIFQVEKEKETSLTQASSQITL
ncbi:transcriptional regulator ATRX homolog isoform X1 [Daphnia magna]|uniref:transcriptional regulator ATRX homolog isoform X1 n=1 Tax=Daphnia magna TaxID=35525 RepID=UPI001E1BDE60|nr:transcriptional regulator ATRX homolog isoform X1 [Daphnia magna]